MTALEPSDLSDPHRYQLLDVLDHDDLVPDIAAYLWRPTPLRNGYLAANALVLVLVGWLVSQAEVGWLNALLQVALGMVGGYLLLVPVHEGIHALTYRAFGARDVSITYRWRSLSAFCIADGFVADSREFTWLALMPFLVINTALIVLIVASESFRLPLTGALLLHAGACSGDAALLNYLWLHRQTGVLTYDDAAAKRSYFYRPLVGDT